MALVLCELTGGTKAVRAGRLQQRWENCYRHPSICLWMSSAGGQGLQKHDVGTSFPLQFYSGGSNLLLGSVSLRGASCCTRLGDSRASGLQQDEAPASKATCTSHTHPLSTLGGLLHPAPLPLQFRTGMTHTEIIIVPPPSKLINTMCSGGCTSGGLMDHKPS